MVNSLYLAHNYNAKGYLASEVVPQFQALGIDVTSRWCQGVAKKEEFPCDDAQMDLDDIDKADGIVLFTEQFGPTPERGKFLELGYAIAKKKAIYLVGYDSKPKDCVFYALPGITRFTQLDTFLIHLKHIRK